MGQPFYQSENRRGHFDDSSNLFLSPIGHSFSGLRGLREPS